MTTQLIYNGVVLKDCRTLTFDQSLEMDESQTDLLYHKFRIRVESICTAANEPPLHGVVGDGGGSAMGMERFIQAQLMHPRGNFSYSIGGFPLVTATASPAVALDLDVNNGPRPMDLKIAYIAGTNNIRVEYEIEVAIVRCGSGISASDTYGAGATEGVLNNRWTLEDTRDSDFYVTRTWDGVLRVANVRYHPHFYRHVVVPPLQNRFRRDHVRFIADATGLVLRYTITDRQTYAAPPPPATGWDATYTESTSEGGVKGFGQVHVRLVGPPDASKAKLITAGVRVVEARLGDLRRGFRGPTNRLMLQSASIVEKLHANEVEVDVRVMRVSDVATWLNIQAGKMGKFLDEGALPIPNYKHDEHLVPEAYDSKTPAGVFAMYLQSPCDNIHGITRSIPVAKQGEDPAAEPYDPVVESYKHTGSIPPDLPSPLQPAQYNNFYVHAAIENRYIQPTGWNSIPIAATVSDNPEQPGPTDPTSLFVRLHATRAFRIFTATLERIGDRPAIPDFLEQLADANAIDEVLLRMELIPHAGELMADGRSELHRVELKYVYALRRALTAQEKLRVGTQPYDITTARENDWDLSNYVDPNAQ